MVKYMLEYQDGKRIEFYEQYLKDGRLYVRHNLKTNELEGGISDRYSEY